MLRRALHSSESQQELYNSNDEDNRADEKCELLLGIMPFPFHRKEAELTTRSISRNAARSWSDRTINLLPSPRVASTMKMIL